MPSPPRRGKWNTCTCRCAIALRQWCAAVVLCLTSLLVTTASVTSVAADKGVSSASAKANGTTASNPYESQILFSPSVITLNNPTGDRRVAFTGSTPVTVTMTVYNSEGNIVQPSSTAPLYVNVYGAPNGVITPTQVVLTSGTSVTFTYNGGAFPNSMELAAWMDDPTDGGASLGTTLLVQQNRPPCTLGAASFDIGMVATVPDAIQVKAVVGAQASPNANLQSFTIDTGSLGVLVTNYELVNGPEVHGPGAPGQKFYNSSGLIFSGHYYLAPVSVQLADHSFVTSNPVLVLSVDSVACHPNYPNCQKPKSYALHYLGVGFDRNKTSTGDLFDSPSENAFLQLTDAQNGTDINQGYILSARGVTLGITAADAHQFDMVPLSPNSTVPGDWNPEAGCYQFTNLTGQPQFCGNLLLDVGIDQMFLDLPSGQRPPGSYDSDADNQNEVPTGVDIKISVLSSNSIRPPLTYEFHAVQPPTDPVGPAPTFVQWVPSDNIFVNTGRRPLLAYDYLYSGQCGQVGFRPGPAPN